MEPIVYIDRQTGKHAVEKVYGAKALKFIYGNDFISRLLGPFFLHSIVKTPLFAFFYGLWQKSSFTKKKVLPFIEKFQIDASEFLLPIHQFRSFNDFFIRQLQPAARPICSKQNCAIIPSDGRYYFYQNISETSGFIVKDQKFKLETLIEDKNLAKKYAKGTMVMARLCPTDYHRYHFPVSCTPGKTRFVNGWLYSVNPLAVQKDIHIFTQNKRTVCELETEDFGKVLFIEIGATNVGSIRQTYTPHQPVTKGEEKGFFEFGASAIILLFEPNQLILDSDLVKATASGFEIRCLMGQSMGQSLDQSVDQSIKQSTN